VNTNLVNELKSTMVTVSEFQAFTTRSLTKVAVVWESVHRQVIMEHKYRINYS